MTPQPAVVPPGRKRRLWPDLTILGIVGVLLVAATITSLSLVQRQFFSAGAFVHSYLDLLASGRAADALQVPGVAIDVDDLRSAGLDPSASEALLRFAALAPLTDIEIVSEQSDDDGVTAVRVDYTANGEPGSTVFHVESNGWNGLAPGWRFHSSPLSVLDLDVRGAMSFTVNGFAVDKRQVSADGIDADPAAIVPMLVFSPGVYSVGVDTPTAASPGVAVLVDAPLRAVPLQVQAQPTPEFVAVVQEQVDAFLASCAEQPVLQPTGCPFGITVQNRTVGAPTWTITTDPEVTVEPAGADWTIPATAATAHVTVNVQLLYDGTVITYENDVDFAIAGTVRILPDGRASITVTGAGEPR